MADVTMMTIAKRILIATIKMRFVSLDYVRRVDASKIRIVSNQVEFAEIVAVLFSVHRFTGPVLRDECVLKIAYAFKENVKKIRIADRRLFALTDFVTWIVYEIRIALED